MSLIRTFTGHTAPVVAAVLLPGNRYILSASGDGTAKMWERDQEEAIRTFNFFAPLTSLALIHEGSAVAGDEAGNVILWDLTTGEIRTVVPGAVGGVRSLAARPSGGLVVAGGDAGWLKVIQGPVLQDQGTIFPAHMGSTNAVALHPLHDVILSGGADMRIRLWGIASETPIHQFEGSGSEQGVILALAISHDGRFALSAAHPRIKLWEIQSTRVGTEMTFTGLELGCLGMAVEISAVAFSGDSRFALSAEFEKLSLRKVNPQDPEENLVVALEGHEQRIRSVAFSSNDRLAVSASEDCTVRLWDLSEVVF